MTERIILHKISTISCKKEVIFVAKNKCKSANMVSSTVQLHGVDMVDIQILIFILYKTHVTI